MREYKIGDKVHIKGCKLAKPEDIFTIAEIYGKHVYRLEEEEVAHFYLHEPNYENIYFGGDLLPTSI